MNEMIEEHPTPQRLMDFASGALSEAEIDAVEEHLRCCETCLQTVDTLPEDRIVSVLRAAEEDVLRESAEDEASGSFPSVATAGTVQVPRGLRSSIPADLVNHPRYRIIDRLGSGGMGVVYLAEHLHLHRKVALKVVRADLLAQGKAVERFQTEVKAAGRLSHPN